MATKPKVDSKQYRSGAGVAGASGGTILALVANNLPPGSIWKPWLILAAPSISVVIGGAVLWARRFLEDFLNSRRKLAFVDRIRKSIEAALNNPNTSSAHKDVLRVKLEELEKLQFDKDFQLLNKEFE